MVKSSTRTCSFLWKSLKVLVEIDEKKKEFASQASKIEAEIEEDKSMLPELEQTISQVKQDTINIKKNVDLLELNAEHTKSQETQKRAALEKIKNQKEFAAIEKELSTLSQQLSEQDDALMKAWHDLETAKSKETEETANLKEKIESIKKDLSEKENYLSELKTKDIELDKEREEKEKDIPEEWILKYNRMKGKVSDPIVPVVHTSCSSCYYSVPPQDMARLKHSALLPCRSCYRFLYYDQEEETDLEEASF